MNEIRDEQEKTPDSKKTTAKQVKRNSESSADKNLNNIDEIANSKDKSTIKTNENEEVVILDKKDEIELTDEINNARKKRRRSSASID